MVEKGLKKKNQGGSGNAAKPAVAGKPGKPAVVKPSTARKTSSTPKAVVASSKAPKPPFPGSLPEAAGEKPVSPLVTPLATAGSRAHRRPNMFPLMENEKLELPRSYGDDRLVMMARDPWWIYCYWDLTASKVEQGIRSFPKGESLRGILRVYDVTDLQFNGSNAHSFRDFDVHFDFMSFYLNVWAANRAYVVELGLLDHSGRFVALLRSNTVLLPREEPSADMGTEWTDFLDAMEEIYRLSGGFENPGKSSEQLPAALQLSRRSMFSSSPGSRVPWGK